MAKVILKEETTLFFMGSVGGSRFFGKERPTGVSTPFRLRNRFHARNPTPIGKNFRQRFIELNAHSLLFPSRLPTLPKHGEKRGLGKQLAIEQQRVVGAPTNRKVVEPALAVVHPPEGHAPHVLTLT